MGIERIVKFILYTAFLTSMGMSSFELIKRNTQEIITEHELKDLLMEKAHPIAYIGYATTNLLHIGHFLPIVKVADFLKAGFNFKFLLANLHAHLDDQKSPWSLLDARTAVYEELVRNMLNSIGADITRLKFVKGSDFQTEQQYSIDVLRMSALTTLSRVKRAASEVVRFGDEPKMGGFIYPLMQCEDVVALEADIAFGGIDQRGIYMLGRELLPELGYKKPLCVFSPLLPSFTGGRMGGKMSASENKGKVGLLDEEDAVNKKVNDAYCPEGIIKENGVMAFVEYIIFPLKYDQGKKLKIERSIKFGGDVEYTSYKELEKDFVKKELHPMDLKKAISREINILLEPIRKNFSKKKDLLREAYPEK